MLCFIQPHFDDVAFSCGALVARAAARGDVPRVVTVFSAGHDGRSPLSTLATKFHEMWKEPAEKIWSIRQDEDRAAMATLGAERIELGFPDAVYRGDDRTSVLTRGRLHRGDEGLPASIADSLRRLRPEREDLEIYAPLGVGEHVDHVLTYLACLELTGPRIRVVFYEDIPYALKKKVLEARLSKVGKDLVASTVEVTGFLPLQLEAMAEYRSQLPALRQFFGNFEEQLAESLATTGDNSARAMRLWSSSRP